jgi:hypothetical protein
MTGLTRLETGLTRLELYNTQITEKGVRELKNALPRCEISLLE